MAEKVFLVHGWSVTDTTTYQALHLKLAEFGFDLHEILLGRYVSLDDHVEVKDISLAMHRALRPHLGPPPWSSGRFHIITHSTGALVVKDWLAKHYVGKYALKKPLKNLVFLAGPHFGSRLAHHGRTMLAHATYLGPTGNKILTALELGSRFSWENNGLWLDAAHWRGKGIRPYCLIGDRVERDFFKRKIFPANYEEGSDMVVRVPAANLNFRRYELDGQTRKLRKVGEVSGIPFAAIANNVHSGEKRGIMGSITTRAQPDQAKYLNLKLILRCLRVDSQSEYESVRAEFSRVTKATRQHRKPFAQLDFRFRDDTGAPVDDYRFVLGAIVQKADKPSKTVAHVHKNKADGSHFTAFIDLKEFEPQLTYFMNLDSDSGTPLFKYERDPLKKEIPGQLLTDIISANQTTQIDVVLGRKPDDNLFVFHPGDDSDLHVKWNRQGEVTKRRISPK
jgi:hypothetical protein